MKPTLHILIVDDDERMTRTLADILTLKGYATTTAVSGSDALEKLAQATFDCVLTDIRMPGMDGVSLFLEIHQRHPHLPVILMTAYAAESLVQQGLDAGATGMLEKPLRLEQLLSFFSYLEKETTVTVVDDDPAFCQTICDILQLRGYTVRKITDPHTAVEDIVGQSQVLLVDMKLNCINGCDLLQSVREHNPTLPVVLVTGYRQEMAEAIQKALSVSAYTCLYKPLSIPELLQTLADIQTNRLKAVLEMS
jgi:DNA-binding NtrC family response regulator